jgi:hypothetical protein
MKTSYLMPFILLTFILFTNKSHSIDVVTDTGTIPDLTIGQLQTFDINTLQYIRFYGHEFEPFAQAQTTNGFFRFYGQPGSVEIAGYQLGGDLSSYDLLLSRRINNSSSAMNIFSSWFLNFPYEPYPSEEEQEEEQEEENNNDDSAFNDADLEFLEKTIITIAITAFSIFGFSSGMTYRFYS